METTRDPFRYLEMNIPLTREFSKRLCKCRLALRMTCKQLAKELHVNITSVRSWEKGRVAKIRRGYYNRVRKFIEQNMPNGVSAPVMPANAEELGKEMMICRIYGRVIHISLHCLEERVDSCSKQDCQTLNELHDVLIGVINKLQGK